MVRTKASVSSAAIRASVAKAPRKNFNAPRSSAVGEFGSPAGKKDKFVGGNSVCARPTPEWQKPIDTFFSFKPKENKSASDNMEPQSTSEDQAGPSSSPQEHRRHDNKENVDPGEPGTSSNLAEEEPRSSSNLADEEPGPSTSSGAKPKRRRILMADSDSDEEEKSQPRVGCIVEMEDTITAC